MCSRTGSTFPAVLPSKRLDFIWQATGAAHDAYQWDCDVKDPSFVMHANGTAVIAYRGVCCEPCTDHTERVGLLVADAWNGTYTRLGTPLFADAEDLFMWTSARGTHMIYHSQAQ